MIDIEYLRSFRLGRYAAFDLVVSYVGFYFLTPLLTRLFKKIGVKVARVQWMYLMLPISVVVHLLFGQDTLLVQDLFSINSGYLTKIIILVMLYKGIKG